MTRVLVVPQRLDDAAFDALVAEAAQAGEERVLLDARHVRWADPYGMIGMLALGETLARDGARPLLELPQSADVLSYLLLLADRLDVDVLRALEDKIALNEAKYPADQVRGDARKYTAYRGK